MKSKRVAFVVVTRAARFARAHFSHIIVSKDSPLRAFHGLKLQSPILRLWRLKLDELCMTINLFCYPSRPPCSFLRLRQSMVWVWDAANVYSLVMSVHRTARYSAFAVAIARQKLLDGDEARIPESFDKRNLGHVYVSSPSSPAELIRP